MFVKVASVRWELPSLLRLPPGLYLGWEPRDGIAAVHLNPEVGQLSWTRRCQRLRPEQLLSQTPDPEDGRALLGHEYAIRAGLEGGGYLFLGTFRPGWTGGFDEPRPYSIATVFLCLRDSSEGEADTALARSAAALNNLVGLHRFATMDPLAREVRAPLDAICNVVSLADVPLEMRKLSAREILERVPTLQFGSAIGRDRSIQIGLNTRDDILAPLSLPVDGLDGFLAMIQHPNELDVHHELFLSAIRRLRRGEHALAIIDAQSAFESFVAAALRDGLLSESVAEAEIERRYTYKGSLDGLAKRTKEMDALARRGTSAAPQFEGSPERDAWNVNLYKPRNQIAHVGVRSVDFDAAKRGIVSGLKAVSFLERMHPGFRRRLSWHEELLDLEHVKETPGSLFRLFQF